MAAAHFRPPTPLAFLPSLVLLRCPPPSSPIRSLLRCLSEQAAAFLPATLLPKYQALQRQHLSQPRCPSQKQSASHLLPLPLPLPLPRILSPPKTPRVRIPSPRPPLPFLLPPAPVGFPAPAHPACCCPARSCCPLGSGQRKIEDAGEGGGGQGDADRAALARVEDGAWREGVACCHRHCKPPHRSFLLAVLLAARYPFHEILPAAAPRSILEVAASASAAAAASAACVRRCARGLVSRGRRRFVVRRWFPAAANVGDEGGG